MSIRVCSTIVQPRHVPVVSKSEAFLVHNVCPSTIFNDPVCDCKGYIFRGHCRHIDEVESNKCTFWTTKDIAVCPNCSAPVIDFELEPEFVGRDIPIS